MPASQTVYAPHPEPLGSPVPTDLTPLTTSTPSSITPSLSAEFVFDYKKIDTTSVADIVKHIKDSDEMKEAVERAANKKTAIEKILASKGFRYGDPGALTIQAKRMQIAVNEELIESPIQPSVSQPVQSYSTMEAVFEKAGLVQHPRGSDSSSARDDYRRNYLGDKLKMSGWLVLKALQQDHNVMAKENSDILKIDDYIMRMPPAGNEVTTP
ncbi:hypothetical protein DPMN_181275 [Dreissena polymorpha]|uniref:Uncharacterized protein n=1 Tax=Dreissena polymorpha TaxID=45954 RepID=A0A9D4I481_DREPO|nr:hypothetical protein DPMN_181275 [Dreissena polymorpha]